MIAPPQLSCININACSSRVGGVQWRNCEAAAARSTARAQTRFASRLSRLSYLGAEHRARGQSLQIPDTLIGGLRL